MRAGITFNAFDWQPWVCSAVFIAAAALADDPLVYATIQPAQIQLGESAQFTITNLGRWHEPHHHARRLGFEI